MKNRNFKLRAILIIISFMVLLTCAASGCGSNNKSLNQDKSKVAEDKSDKIKSEEPKEDIKPNVPNNRPDNQTAYESSLNKSILGAWELIEVTQNGKTEKADSNKKLLPEESLIYVFSENSMDIYMFGQKVVVPYSWTGKDTIQGMSVGDGNEEQEKIKMNVKIKDNKLYITIIDDKKEKGELVFQKYTGKLPEAKSN